MNTPDGLKYTKTHEWVKVENGVAIEGLTDFAQSELSDIAFVELPTIGKKVNQGDAIGTIEAVKAVSDLVAGVSGEIMEVNDELQNSPDKINIDPYNGGWIVKIKISNPADTNNLLDKNSYIKHCESSHH